MTDIQRPPIIAYGPLYPYLTQGLEDRFTVHAVAADADPTTLPDTARTVRALVSFGSVAHRRRSWTRCPIWK